MPVTIGTTYFINYYLLPNYLMKQRYGFFILYFIYTAIVSVFFALLVVVITFILIAEFQIKNMSPASVDVFFLMTALLMIAFLAMTIKLLLHWQASREEYQKLMRDKIEAELKFLKVQLNPHFLFNTLNNLYFLTTEKSDMAPKAVLQLSELMDYVLQSGKTDFVRFENEIKQIANYIALERMRYSDRITINASISKELDNCLIPPMILITLLENAFKHGVMNIPGKSRIDLNINSDNEKMKIVIRNNTVQKNKRDGIGLKIISNQLEFLYRDAYNLIINTEDPEVYSVELTIPKRS